MTAGERHQAPPIEFPDWVPPLVPPAARKPTKLGERVEVRSKLSTWSVPRVWMSTHGERPCHEMVLELGEHEVLG
jgi:hypothetical protein